MATTVIRELVSIQSPFVYGEDANGRGLFSVNFVGRADTSAYLEKAVAAIIAGAGLGVLGTDLFVGPLAVIPDGDGPYTTVIATAGYDAEETHNYTKYESISFQIAVRALDYLAGKARIHAIWALLDGIHEPSGVRGVTVTTT